MLQLTVTGEGCRRVEFGTDSWVDSLDLDRLHVCGFTLRLLTWKFFDLAVEPLKGDHFEVGHLCVQPNAVLTATLHVDYKRLLAGSGGVPGDGEGVCSGIEMKGHEAAGADVG